MPFRYVDGVLEEYQEQPKTPDQIQAELDLAKEMKRQDINDWRANEENRHLLWNGRRWQMRKEDREKIMGIVLAGVAPPNGYWTDADDNDVPMTAFDMQALYMAGVSRLSAIHDHQRSKKNALKVMDDISLVQSLIIEDGWVV